jgi:hypothetical protein
MMAEWLRRVIRSVAVLTGGVVAAGSAGAATPIDSVSASPDVGIVLSGALFHDEDVAIDDLLGGVAPENLGALPAAGAIDAYHLASDGNRFFSFDTTVELPGGVIAGPADVVSYDGVGYGVRFDGAAQGIPAGVAVDAFTFDSDVLFLVSFDTTVELAGSVFHDEDVARFTGGGGFIHVFDGSNEGVPAGLDVDAVHFLLENGHLALSFDTSGSVGGVDFDDEDVLEFDPVTRSWELVYDGSALHAGWVDGDLEAVHMVPEPATRLQLAAGALFLAAARVCRTHRTRRETRRQ